MPIGQGDSPENSKLDDTALPTFATGFCQVIDVYKVWIPSLLNIGIKVDLKPEPGSFFHGVEVAERRYRARCAEYRIAQGLEMQIGRLADK